MRLPTLHAAATIALLIACGGQPASGIGTDTDTDAGGTTRGETSEHGATADSDTTVTSGSTTTGSGSETGSTSDASTGTTNDADTGGPPLPSKCEQTDDMIVCPKETTELDVALLVSREVHWQVPAGEPPPGGWPIAFMFQGSLFTSELNWVGHKDAPLGMYWQVLTLKQLLDAGYAVITPEARGDGSTFWDTNIPPYSFNWDIAPDHEFMLAIFFAIEQGEFGPLDKDAMYATGISSGGYMTSRMAVSYPGMFSALAIQSASYATCGGPLCQVPALSPEHEPTLFLHGDQDLIVPIATMYEYRDALDAAGIETHTIVNPNAGHEWIAEAPDAVLAWFDDHPPS